MLIAGPNLTIDRTLAIEELRPGEVLRFHDVVVTPGGKGVNVARVARALRAPALLVGFTPGRTGAAAGQLLVDEGLRIEPVPTGGELRSTAVIMERGGRVTVINEPGPAIAPEDWERYEAAVGSRLERNGVLVCSGSVPPGTPSDAYGRLVECEAPTRACWSSCSTPASGCPCTCDGEHRPVALREAGKLREVKIVGFDAGPKQVQDLNATDFVSITKDNLDQNQDALYKANC